MILDFIWIFCFLGIIRLTRHNNGIKIETSENTKVTKAHRDDIPKGDKKKGEKKHGDNPQKFETYFNFQGYLNNMHSHQTLAINRGENLKVIFFIQLILFCVCVCVFILPNFYTVIVFFYLCCLQFLSVKIVIPDRIQNELYNLIRKKYFINANNPEYMSLLSAALNDAYSKKCEIISII